MTIQQAQSKKEKLRNEIGKLIETYQNECEKNVVAMYFRQLHFQDGHKMSILDYIITEDNK